MQLFCDLFAAICKLPQTSPMLRSSKFQRPKKASNLTNQIKSMFKPTTHTVLTFEEYKRAYYRKKGTVYETRIPNESGWNIHLNSKGPLAFVAQQIIGAYKTGENIFLYNSYQDFIDILKYSSRIKRLLFNVKSPKQPAFKLVDKLNNKYIQIYHNHQRLLVALNEISVELENGLNMGRLDLLRRALTHGGILSIR